MEILDGFIGIMALIFIGVASITSLVVLCWAIYYVNQDIRNRK